MMRVTTILRHVLLAAVCLASLPVRAQQSTLTPDLLPSAASLAATDDVLCHYAGPLQPIRRCTPAQVLAAALAAGNLPLATSAALTLEQQRATAAEAALQARLSIEPDTLKVAADGADDAPSIQRAVAAACGSTSPLIAFRARHYALLSPITQSCFVDWLGRGWREQNAIAATAPGTFFDIGPTFINSGTSPITFTAGSEGSTVRRIGFAELGHPPAPVPVVNGSNAVTGWTPAAWTPAAYAPVLTINGAPGVTVKDVMLLGINAGLVCVNSGRCDFRRVKGQVFGFGINIQDAYDRSTIEDVHFWPYWSAADPVMQYAQANASGIISFRNDTPMWDRLFLFGLRDGVLISGQADGTTTGLGLGTLSCDFVQTCLRVDATASGVTFQTGPMRSYSQAWNTVAGAPVTMLAGSSVMSLAGSTVASIGPMESFGSDTAVVRFLGTGTKTSNLVIANLFTHASRMSVGAVEFSYPSSGSNTVSLYGHQIEGPAPSGFTSTNLAKGGAGTLYMPSMTSVQ